MTGTDSHSDSLSNPLLNQHRVPFEKNLSFKVGGRAGAQCLRLLFALPALFFVDLAETSFVVETITFVYAGLIPVLGVVAIYVLLFLLLSSLRTPFICLF